MSPGGMYTLGYMTIICGGEGGGVGRQWSVEQGGLCRVKTRIAGLQEDYALSKRVWKHFVEGVRGTLVAIRSFIFHNSFIFIFNLGARCSCSMVARGLEKSTVHYPIPCVRTEASKSAVGAYRPLLGLFLLPVVLVIGCHCGLPHVDENGLTIPAKSDETSQWSGQFSPIQLGLCIVSEGRVRTCDRGYDCCRGKCKGKIDQIWRP